MEALRSFEMSGTAQHFLKYNASWHARQHACHLLLIPRLTNIRCIRGLTNFFAYVCVSLCRQRPWDQPPSPSNKSQTLSTVIPVLNSICKSASELYESVWGRGGIVQLILDLGTISGNFQLYVLVATVATNVCGTPGRPLLYVTFLAARIFEGSARIWENMCTPVWCPRNKSWWVPGTVQTVCRRDTTLVFAGVCTRL